MTEFKFRKKGTALKFVLHAETTDKILFLAENGRFYTVAADKLPRGRGFGEPLSLMLDIAADGELVSMIKAASGKILIASSAGHGLVTDIENAIAQTRTGKQVLNVGGGARAVRCIAVDGDSVAVAGL